MHRQIPAKTHALRAAAFMLLAVMAWAVLTPEANVYSFDKTFIKSHTPATDSFALALTADDKEDNDEDGTVDIQLSPALSVEWISLATFSRACKIKGIPLSKKNDHQVYIFHRQLRI